MEMKEKAFKLFKESNGNITTRKIADILGIKASQVNNWRYKEKWKEKINKSRGAPKGNKNAVDNNGGAPKGNLNHLVHGEHLSDERFFKGLPKTMVNSMKDKHNESYLDKLWRSILIQEARIIAMQKITYVKNKNDLTKELKKETWGTKSSSQEYELQFAHDKENNSVQALSRAMDTLAKMIKQYDEMINKNWSLVTEEQKLRIEKLKAEISKLNGDDKNSKEDKIDSYFKKLEEGIKNA